LKYGLRGTGIEPPTLQRGSSEIDLVSTLIKPPHEQDVDALYFSESVEDEV